jgi:hypothetical protein
MRSRVLFGLALAAIGFSAGLALGQEKKPKGKGIPRLELFSQMVYAVEPNIEAVLMFSDEQKEKLDKAVSETVHAPALQELKPKKGEPADATKQAKFKEEMGKARGELKKRTDEILTTEQKATVQKIEDSLKKALDGVLTQEQKDKLQALKKKPKKGS